MLIEKIALRNFLSYKDAKISLNGSPLIVLSGKNGTGKSSLFDAITLALFKKARSVEKGNIDNLVNSSADKMGVGIHFSLNGDNYSVTLVKERGKVVKHVLSRDNEKIVEGTNNVIEHLEKLLNMNYDMFISSVFLLQGRSDFFLVRSSDERKQILSRTIGLNIYSKVEKLARELRKQHSKDFEGFEVEQRLKKQSIDDLKRSIEGYGTLDDLSKSADRHRDKLTEVEDECNKLRDKISTFRDKSSILKELGKLDEEISKMQSSAHTLIDKLKLKESDEVSAKITELEKSKKEKAEEFEDLTLVCKSESNMVVDLKASAKAVLESIDKLSKSKDKCTVCLSKLSDERRKDLLNKFESERGKWNNKVAKTQSHLDEVNNRRYEVERELKEIDNEINKLNAAVAQNEESRSVLKLLKSQYKTLKEKRSELSEELVKVNETGSLKEQYENNVRVKKDIAEKLEDVVRKKAVVESTEEKTTKLMGELLVTQSSLDLAKRETYCYDKIVKACDEKGIPSLIIDQVLPQFCEEANRILRKLTQGQLTIDFSLDNEKKKLDCTVKSKEGDRLYELCSGGEKFKVDLAVRLALSLLLSQRSGTKIETIFIDEGAGCLDNEGRNYFVDLLNYASTRFKKILLITHIDELKDNFDNVIEFRKDKRGSYVTYN